MARRVPHAGRGRVPHAGRGRVPHEGRGAVRLPIRLTAVAVALTGLTGGLIVGSTPASARNIKAEIASAHQQVAALNRQAEAASERYNAARIELDSAKTAAQHAGQALANAKAKTTSLEQKVTAFAVAAYRGDSSNSLVSLIEDGDAGSFVSRLSSLQAVSASQAATLAQVKAARRVQEQAQATANAALAQQKSATASMLANRNQALQAASKEQQILQDLQVKEAAIIKAAKARAARIAAEQEQARLRAEAAAAAQASSVISNPNPPPAPHISGSGGAATAVHWAYQELGKPYVWAAAGPNSFDCSGLTQYVWAKAGVYLGHYTGSQWNEGSRVSRDQLEPGDLVFFVGSDGSYSVPGHVGIYIGHSEMIDAPYTGVNVRIESAFRSDYIGAVRPG
jgi:cell wall-associated NlpC family hydrolase